MAYISLEPSIPPGGQGLDDSRHIITDEAKAGILTGINKVASKFCGYQWWEFNLKIQETTNEYSKS